MSQYTREEWAAIKEARRDEQRYGRPVAYVVRNVGPSRHQRRHPEMYKTQTIRKPDPIDEGAR